MKKETITEFAPIIIPTLNRYIHFKRCVETLARCKYADQTELVIGLDYPPTEKYEEGYKKIKAYLPTISSFKKVTVLSTDKNLGAGGNLYRLHKYIREVGFESFISTEDDNEFSSNFLEYVNWALNEYKDDESIYAVCGFKRIDTSGLKNNVYKYPRFNAWGYGSWYKKRDKLTDYYDLNYLKKNLLDHYPLKTIFSKDIYYPCSIISMLSEGNVYGDALVNFLPKDEQYCLFPTTSMVRNHGQDGMGLHGGSKQQQNMYENLPIDSSESFEPIIVEDLYQPILEEKYTKTYPISKKRTLRCVIEFLLYKTTGSVIKHKYKDPWYKVKLKKVQ